MTVRVLTIDMASPADMAGIEAALTGIGPARLRRLAVLVKVEGNYAPNDFSRELTRRTLHETLSKLGVLERTVTLQAIGCEGVATPLAYLIADVEDEVRATAEPRLAFGFARSAAIPPAECGSRKLLDPIVATVAAALADAGLTVANAGLVMVKVPTIHPGTAGTTPDQGSMRRGRSLAGLGAGIALGEIDPARVTDAIIGRDGPADLYARRAMTFAGPETDRIEVIALGNRPGASGDLVVAVTFMSDILDRGAIHRLLAENGVAMLPGGTLADPGDVPALLVKAGIAPDGSVRGARTMVYSSTFPAESHLRAAASGVVGSLLGHTRFFISGDPIHHAPPGGGVAAAIIRKR
jgi:cyanuric acid amidohydrolase